MEEDRKFEPMGTKISPAMAVVWNAVCDALHTDTYHLLQQFIYAMIRSASEQHEKTPDVQRLLDALELDPGWQNAINLCAPNGKFKIAQMILIVEDEDKRGFGVHMLDKPFMGECQQTENVDRIFERLAEVIYKREYIKLRQLGIRRDVKSIRELLSLMIEEQTAALLDKEFKDEMPGIGDRTEGGRLAGSSVYGKRTKQTKRRTPDGEANRQQRIVFTDEDRQLADSEAGHDSGEDMEKEMGFKPFGQEW
jgi:hypothetical protein